MLSKDVSSHTSIAVDTMSLFESNIAFAHYVFQSPRRALQLLDDAFQKVSLNISRNHILKADMKYKENLHVRLIALPNLPEVYRSNLPCCSDVGQFLCISGTVVRTSSAKMLQYKKQWRCGKCKYQFIVEAEVEQGYVCEKPQFCCNPEWCSGKNFTLMSSDINAEWCKDYQEIKLQEQVYNLNVGSVPKSMWVVLEDDLVGSCHPGNDVLVSGVLIQQWKPLLKDRLIDIQLVILAHNIEVQNKLSTGVISKDMAKEFGQFWQDHKSDALNGRNFILSSICPQVFGLYIVKLAVALVLSGGVQKQSGNSRIRGDSHLLLVGDPGTAKSQFLKFATKVSSRSVLTSGIGTTNAGLTVSAVKESGRWQLEAGALVLADGGICCIDEFSCIKEQDKTCIHEAMEQQTISVAKAGLVCSLNTRCSIIAATNPKGKYDDSMSISENTALGSPLLSRFDIILVLLDTCDEKWDDLVSSYILDGRNVINENSKSKLWSAAKMKNYFTLIRRINPKVSVDAERVLRAYYTRQRCSQSRQSSRTTPRLLQSLIRLAEGHARLMFRTEVLIMDAVIAVILIESSMLGNSVLEELSPLHTVFPDDSLAEYREKAEQVLKKLNLDMSVDERYEHFYEESTINNLLADISAVWGPKEDPFIFGDPSSERCSNTSQSAENGTGANEITACEINDFTLSSITEKDFFHKNAQELNHSTQISTAAEQIIVAEVHRNYDDTTSHFAQNELRNQITTLSGLKNIFEDDMIGVTATENVFDKNTNISKSSANLSVLDQILEEPDFHQYSNKSIHSTLKTLSKTENIFSNSVFQEKTSMNSKMPIKKCAKSQPKRNTVDVFEQLGISPEKEFETHVNNLAGSLIEVSSSLPAKTIPVNIFPAKRSIADQLKNFAFSKSQINSHRFPTDKDTTSSSENKSKNDSKCDSEPQAKKHCSIGNAKDQTGQYADKNNSNLTLEDNELEENFQKSSNSFEMDQDDITIKNQCSQNTGSMFLLGAQECSQNHQPFVREVPTSKESKNAEQPHEVIGKKSLSDKLKMFVFSKTRTSKVEKSTNEN